MDSHALLCANAMRAGTAAMSSAAPQAAYDAAMAVIVRRKWRVVVDRPPQPRRDGLIEAVESGSEHFMVGVQWHPEVFEMTNPHTRPLFNEFVAAARSYGGTAGR